jgi:nanoRNase/pAp phosphatase (c-di-AMP/oligoRNAs hydrolase)
MLMMKERLDLLFEAVGNANSILILPHNDPDPDAIASAVALRHLLAERSGVEGHIVYRGIVGRAENKALGRYLGYPLRRLERSDLLQSVPIALVDTQPSAGNNSLPPESSVAIVFDHHPRREATAAATFADVRPDVGATSTILMQYLQAADIEITPPLATALFYGIKTDTMGLARDASPDDIAAYFYLQPRIDVDALVEIERAKVPAEYFEGLVDALQAAHVYDGVVISYMGPMRRPDMAAEMADILLRLENTSWIICMGVYKDELIMSVRTWSQQVSAGELAQEIVGDRGTAGGHGSMAGGQILLEGETPEGLAQRLTARALQYLKVAPDIASEPLI